MIGQRLMEGVTGEPTDRQIHLRFAHQAPVVDDAKKKPGKHQAPPPLRDRSQVGPYPSCSNPTPLHAASSDRAHDQPAPECDRRGEARAAIRRQTARAGPDPSAPTSRLPRRNHPKLLGTESQRRLFFNSPTRQRCHEEFRTLAMAAFSPSWASETTSLTPRRPRRASLRRKSLQKLSASEVPIARPSTSRRPSPLTPTATITATETTWPSRRAFT